MASLRYSSDCKTGARIWRSILTDSPSLTAPGNSVTRWQRNLVRYIKKQTDYAYANARKETRLTPVRCLALDGRQAVVLVIFSDCAGTGTSSVPNDAIQR